MLTAPMIYWWTETSVIDATAGSLICWLAPSAVGSIILIGFYSRQDVRLPAAPKHIDRKALLDVQVGIGGGVDKEAKERRQSRIIFEPGIPLRRALTAKLFTGAYRHVIDEIVIPRVLYVIDKRLLR